MSEVDQMFEVVVNPWWDRNRMGAKPDFAALRVGLSPYSARCQHAAWNEIGRWFMRGADGAEKRELLGLQCLVEALLAHPTNDSAAWTAFSGSTRPELARVQERLSTLPRRPEPGDNAANQPLVDDLRTILGEPGAKPLSMPQLDASGRAVPELSGSAGQKGALLEADRSRLVASLLDSGIHAALLAQDVKAAGAIDELIEILRNEPEPPPRQGETFPIRSRTIRVLGELGDVRAIKPLMQCYEVFRRVAAAASVELRIDLSGAETAKERTLRLLQHKAGDIANEAVRNLKEDPELAAAAVFLHLQDENYVLFAPFVRSDIARALGKIKSEDSRIMLADILAHDGNASVREEAARALAGLQDPRAAEELGRYLQEQIPAQQWDADKVNEAIDLLAGLSGEHSRQLLREFCEKCNDRGKLEFRNRAARHLGLPGKKAGCFIVTAACGFDAPETAYLRAFRDQRLLTRSHGRVVVWLYERLSPPLAACIRNHALARFLARTVLVASLVRAVRAIGFRPD